MCLLLGTTAWQEGPGRQDHVLQSPGNGAGKARVGRCWEAAPPACPAVLPLHPGLTSTQPQRNPALGGQGGPQIFLWGSPWRNQCAGQIRLPKGSKGFPGEKKKGKKNNREEGGKGAGRRRLKEESQGLRPESCGPWAGYPGPRGPGRPGHGLSSPALLCSPSARLHPGPHDSYFLGQAGLDSGLFSPQARVCAD